MRVWETQRAFELHLDQGIVQGRADVILVQENGEPGRLAIVDYKTGEDVHKDDVFAFLLAIYAAAGRGEGLKVEAAYLHELATRTRKSVAGDSAVTKIATARANPLIAGLVAKKFPVKTRKRELPQM